MGAAGQRKRACFARTSGTPGEASWHRIGHFLTLFELRDALADAEVVQARHFSIANGLSRLGFTFEKVTGRG